VVEDQFTVLIAVVMKISKPFFICLALFALFFSQPGFCALGMTSDNTMATSKYTLSFEKIKSAAENGNSDAQYALGYMYYYGKGGAPKNINLAKNWINKSAAQRQPQAIKALALINTHQAEPVRARNPNSTLISNDEQQNTSPPSSTTEVPAYSKKKEDMTLVDMRNKTATQLDATLKAGDCYTLQLLGAFNKMQIDKFIKEKHLSGRTRLHKTRFKNKDWYILLYGYYPTKAKARNEATYLEKKLGIKPWVKPCDSIK
jgi:DamX protein